MTLLAVHPLAEPVPCLRGLDPAKVMALYDCDLVYLLHLDRPFVVNGYEWQHYLGSVKPGKLVDRMLDHRTGSGGAKFLQLARVAGITWHLARVWQVPEGRGRYAEEQRIKRMGGASRSCPSCGVIPRSGRHLYCGPGAIYVKPERETP